MKKRLRGMFLRPNAFVLIALLYIEVLLVSGYVASLVSFDFRGPSIGFLVPTVLIAAYLIVVLIAYLRGRREIKASSSAKPSKAYRVSGFGTLVNLAFTAFNLVMSLLGRSPWYATMAGYYMFLMLARLQALYSAYKAEEKYAGDEETLAVKKERIALRSGIVSLFLSAAISSALGTILASGRPGASGIIQAVAVALYTFYKLGRTVFMAVSQKRKGSDPIVSALVSINLADAVFSMMTLMVLMEATFAEGGSLGPIRYVLAALAALAVLATGIYSVARHASNLRRMKKGR